MRSKSLVRQQAGRLFDPPMGREHVVAKPARKEGRGQNSILRETVDRPIGEEHVWSVRVTLAEEVRGKGATAGPRWLRGITKDAPEWVR